MDLAELQIGEEYTKAGFGIKAAMLAEHIVAGECLTFFTMKGKYRNMREPDGFVYQDRAEYSLIPYGVKTDLHRHVFVRNDYGESFAYLGKGLYETRYDEKRNKIFLNANGGAGRKEFSMKKKTTAYDEAVKDAAKIQRYATEEKPLEMEDPEGFAAKNNKKHGLAQHAQEKKKEARQDRDNAENAVKAAMKARQNNNGGAGRKEN